jgi:hypothetical protein
MTQPALNSASAVQGRSAGPYGYNSDIWPGNVLMRGAACPMSALIPKADMCTATKDVRFVPTADIPHRINKSKKDYLWLKRALAYQAMDESALSFEA